MTGRPTKGRPTKDRPAVVEPGSDRPTPLRLARLHLRMGSLGLARAELESLAGRGRLDEDALLDLAEVRWRTGDLAGAGEAATSLLDRGREDAVALVIAAEAVAAQGRPGEARRLAGRALEAAETSLDALFAGMPRSPIWPGQAPSVPEALPAATPTAAPSEVAPSVATVPRAPGPAGRLARRAPGTDADVGLPASGAAAEAFAGGRAALADDDDAQAALQLGVALRLEPAYARAILDAIEDHTAAGPALALVAGDALRLLGREAEALTAYARAGGVGRADD